mmetsp:Transcript_57928/g.170032  ORF Transcript_57928/g.170032 Transcript_57928/m.170032 type:complete len:804 (+) Transcript_57928:118-2529(+)
MEGSSGTTQSSICRKEGRDSGLVFPLMGEQEESWSDAMRITIYGVGLVYFFVGVAIVADMFMNSIETVTSLRVKRFSNGRHHTVKVWNETVATLTLMALGSSAPEIFLAVVDIVKKRFHFGQLGPATIVGSGSFNLLMIVAVCILVIPSDEVRIIKNLPAFYITAFFSMVAYVWMAVTLLVITPGVVDLWEAVVTFALLPALVIVSWLVDRGDADWIFRAIKLSGSDDDEDEPKAILHFATETLSTAASEEEQTLEVSVCRRGETRNEVAVNYQLQSMSAVPGYDYEPVEGTLEFAAGETVKTIKVPIVARKPWRTACSFIIVLEDIEGPGEFNEEDDGGDDNAILTVTIEALGDVGGCWRAVDGVMNINRFLEGFTEWKEQIVGSIYCNGSKEEQAEASCTDWFCHILALPWKLFFCPMPPTCYGGGWLTFVACLGGIGFLTACVSDLAELFGCVAGIPDVVTAISFVALGTSMPDLFASLTAAREDPTADASVVNVTGSNSVNVFLGLGLPWTIAATWWHVNGPDDEWLSKYGPQWKEYVGEGKAAFIVEAEGLDFSTILFCIQCLCALMLLHLRRKWIGCELGGPFVSKVAVAGSFILQWLLFLALASYWCLRARNSNALPWYELEENNIFQPIFVLSGGSVVMLLLVLVPVLLMKRQQRRDLKEHGFPGSPARRLEMELKCLSADQPGSKESSRQGSKESSRSKESGHRQRSKESSTEPLKEPAPVPMREAFPKSLVVQLPTPPSKEEAAEELKPAEKTVEAASEGSSTTKNGSASQPVAEAEEDVIEEAATGAPMVAL